MEGSEPFHVSCCCSSAGYYRHVGYQATILRVKGMIVTCPTPTLQEPYKGLTVFMALVVLRMLPGGTLSGYVQAFCVGYQANILRVKGMILTCPTPTLQEPYKGLTALKA
ncbi:hypothetical protein ACLB2K_041206 [Fragaria x ananassa]